MCEECPEILTDEDIVLSNGCYNTKMCEECVCYEIDEYIEDQKLLDPSKRHHKSKKGKIFEDPITKEHFRVYEWLEHSPGIIRALKKEKVQVR